VLRVIGSREHELDGADRRRGAEEELGCLSMIAPRCGGMFHRQVDLAVLQRGHPHRVVGDRPEHHGLDAGPRASTRVASSTISSVLRPADELVRPVPIGFLDRSAVSLPADSFGGSIPLCTNVITGTKSATASWCGP